MPLCCIYSSMPNEWKYSVCKMLLQGWCWWFMQTCCSSSYQLVEYRELCLTCVPHYKACTDVLQTWHVPGEAANDQPVLFSDLRFIKEDIKKDINGSRKRTFVTGNREFCATPLFAHETSRDKLQNLVPIYIHWGKVLFLQNS